MFRLMVVAALTCVALLCNSPIANAKGSAEAGAAKAGACIACHGLNGNSTNPEWPSLAGQNAVYIAEQLRLYRDNKRIDPNMNPQAAVLSDQDIEDLAAYYATLTPSGLEADPSYWRAGEQLYRAGDARRQIPACKACHGPVGRGNPANGYPALRAQHAVYTLKQLNDYASENRYRDPQGTVHRPRNATMMVQIAKRLTPEDMRNLASYIQGLR
ncbi:MAG: cytochrome c4 [Steroidobacteraceae bacterium]|nr:cytochrome c4 [Steroidobacteraceae bacterium]MDW8258469.1 c-type cytochrome [Gammaproteobacteria bacterium]